MQIPVVDATGWRVGYTLAPKSVGRGLIIEIVDRFFRFICLAAINSTERTSQ